MERPMVYIERNFSSLSKLVTVWWLSRCTCAARINYQVRCVWVRVLVHRLFEKSHRYRRRLVGPDPYVMGSNPGACQKPNHKSHQALLGLDFNVMGSTPGRFQNQNHRPRRPLLGPNTNVIGSNPGDVRTHNRNPTGHGSCPGLFFVQTSNLNCHGFEFPDPFLLKILISRPWVQRPSFSLNSVKALASPS